MPRTQTNTRTKTNTRLVQQNTNSSKYFTPNNFTSIIAPTGITTTPSAIAFGGWFKYYPDTSQLYPHICSFPNDGAGFYITRNVNSLNIKFVNISGVNYDNYTGQKVQPDTWFHVVGTYDGNYIKAYLNGKLIFTYAVTGVLTLSSTNFQAGSNLTGNLSSIFACNRALTANEVMQLYTNNSPINNMQIYWPFNEGSGLTALDISGTGNNGTNATGTYSSDVPFKTRKLVNDNLVYNGNFEYAPPINVSSTAGNAWIDGTVGGSSTNNLFGWRAELSAGSMSSQFDNSTSRSGNWSLKCSITTINSRAEIWSTYNSSVSLLQYAIPLKSGTTYKLSGWIKTQVNSGASTTGAYFFVNVYSGTGTYITTPITTTQVNTTTGWTYYENSFTASANNNLAIVGMAINGTTGTGTLIMDAWFDDIVLVPTITPTRTLIV